MSRVLFLLLVGLTLLTATAEAGSPLTFDYCQNIDWIADCSDVIVKGKVVGRTETTTAKGLKVVELKVKVKKFLRGKDAKDLVVRQVLTANRTVAAVEGDIEQTQVGQEGYLYLRLPEQPEQATYQTCCNVGVTPQVPEKIPPVVYYAP